MNIDDYNKLQRHENDNHLAIDFDGVVHGNSKGFYDGTVYDNPIEGSIEAIKSLAKKYQSRGSQIIKYEIIDFDKFFELKKN